MPVFGHCHLILLLLTSLTVFTNDAYLRKYVPLIIGINERYGPSSIYLIMPFSRERANDLTATLALTREFSRKGISSLMINSEETLKRVKKYDERIRPIVVVVVTAVEDMDRFASIKNKYDISHSIWLVIFEDEFGVSICDFCNKPTNNIFGLRFDTEMLVVCCKNESLREWWSDHRNRTETASIGEWSVEDGLTLITNQSLYARRSDLAGVGFRVGFPTNSIFYSEKNGGQPAGLFNDVLMELARVINFKIAKILKKEDFGSRKTEEANWTGVIGLIERDLIELGIGEFIWLTERRRVIDFTVPVIVNSVRVYFSAVNSAAAYFKVFALEIWIVIILLVIASPLLVALMNIRTTDVSFRNLIAEHYLNVWGIFCQQGLATFPLETPLRIAYYSIYIAAIVVSAAYSATLISFLTVSTSSVPFTSLSDFVNDGSYAFTVVEHDYKRNILQHSNDPSAMKAVTLIKPIHELPGTVEEAFDEVCKRKVAFVEFEDMVNMKMTHFPCKMSQIRLGSVARCVMVLEKGSEYTGIMNYHIHRIKETGMLNRLKAQYMPIPTEPQPELIDVTLTGVESVLLVLAGGMAVSLIVMLSERIGAIFCQVARKWGKSKRKTIYPRKKNIPRVIIRKKNQANCIRSFSLKRPGGRSNIPAIEFCP